MNILNNYWANRKWKNGRRVGSYRANWIDTDGRTRHESGFSNHASALAFAKVRSAEVKDSIASARFVSGKPWQSAVNEYCTRIKGRRRRITSVTHKLNEKHLRAFFNSSGIPNVDKIDKGIIGLYEFQLRRDGYSENGIRLRLEILKSFCSYAFCAGWLKEEVSRQIVLPDRVPRVSAVIADVHEPDEDPNQLLTPEQCVERLLQFEPDHRDVDEFWIRAIRFGKATKITIGQLFQLKWSDYDLRTRRIHIKCNGRDPERDVLLNEEALTLLGQPKEGRIFNRYPTINAMKVAFNRRAKRWYLPGVRFRDLVHPENLLPGRPLKSPQGYHL